jgi:hypothetical protein
MKYKLRCFTNVEKTGFTKADTCWNACQVILLSATGIDIEVNSYQMFLSFKSFISLLFLVR